MSRTTAEWSRPIVVGLAIGTLGATLGAQSVAPRCLRALDAVEVDSRTSLGPLSGRRIHSVIVVTDRPDITPPAYSLVGRLRATTLTSTVTHQLQFAAGDTVDTLRVAETVRRLRDQRIFDDVVLEARACAIAENPVGVLDTAEEVDLTVRTRDSWTLQPTARVVTPSGLAVGLADRDVLGTGKTFAVTELQSSAGRGGAIAITDPWLFGGPLIASGRLADLGLAHQFSATVATNALTIYQPWVEEAVVTRWVQGTPARDTATEAVVGSIRVGKLVASSSQAVSRLYVGVELDSLSSSVAADSSTSPTNRRFVGGDVGLRRQSARFDTVSWLVPGRGFLDVPIGAEGDGLAAVGRNDAAPGSPWGARYDAWLGRIWLPRRGTMFTTDGWASGFVGGEMVEDRVLRVAASAYQRASDGFWGARAIHEELIDGELDTRLRALVTVGTDPTLPAVPGPFRSPRTATAVSMERSFHLLGVGGASVLDAAAFAASSARIGSAFDPGASASVTVAGARLRFLSANGGVSSVRVECAYPIAGSATVRRKLYFALSAGSLYYAGRGRDGGRG